jgi:MoxR-like ATPase
LRGPTGTGKTFAIRELAKLNKVKLYTLNMTVNKTEDDIKGKWVPKGKDFVWVDGLLTKAMKEGAWIVVEEANFMATEISSNFYSPMDDRREMVLEEKDGETIKAHEDFRMFLTANWDYQGTTRFNDAISNRINSWFDLEYLTKDKEARLIADRSKIELSVAKNMATFAAAIRINAKKCGFPDLSTRILLNWAQFVKEGKEPLEAAEFSVIPVLAYSQRDKEVVAGYLKSIFNARKRDEDDD